MGIKPNKNKVLIGEVIIKLFNEEENNKYDEQYMKLFIEWEELHKQEITALHFYLKIKEEAYLKRKKIETFIKECKFKKVY